MSTGPSNNMLISRGVTICCTIFQLQFTSTFLVFTRQNAFEKKLREVLIEQIIEFELKGPGLVVAHVLLQLLFS